jgi:hypothetical protein
MVALVMVIEPVFSAAIAVTPRERTRVSTKRIDKNFFMVTFLSINKIFVYPESVRRIK